jgi:hypothetical protein
MLSEKGPQGLKNVRLRLVFREAAPKIKVDHAKIGSRATPPFPDYGRKDGLSIFASAESAHLN